MRRRRRNILNAVSRENPRHLRTLRFIEPAQCARVVGLIQPAQQLIHQQQLRLRGQCSRKQRQTPLAVGKRQKGALRQVRDRQAFQQSCNASGRSASVSGFSGMSVRYRPVPMICATV